MHTFHSIRCKIVLHHNSVHILPSHCSCNKHRFIFCTDIYPVLGHGGSQWHLLHSVVLNRWSWQRSLLTISGSPCSVWNKVHISYNHSTELRQLMQALLCVDSRHHSNWTAKSLQQEKADGGVPSKWRWESMEWCIMMMITHNVCNCISSSTYIYKIYICNMLYICNMWATADIEFLVYILQIVTLYTLTGN